ncbi:alpha/beta hydrolase [Cytobacillus sp. OWB-43]|uniref:alpha/beta hydrolase n=1 Tax=unclassified Cytobacillus TaxID=2675268 RepID=UPI002AFF47F5|nr:alpha/beta hydrolase [Cytobacillus sp. OWB-43]MEA1852348.1 alpha/beta hydrolase [Cytobacillus sp. OWB-43]
MASLSERAKLYLESFYSGPKIESFDPIELKEIQKNAPIPEQNILPHIHRREERLIKVNDGAEIRLCIYSPEGEGPFPALVYYHGGGWVIGSVEMFEAANRLVATEAKTVVISVDYRLAPENQFPIPMNDCYTALEWVANHAEELNVDLTKVSVGGDSAGGNLSTVIAKRALNNGPSIQSQVLIYPVTNLEFNTNSYNEFAEGYGLDRDLMKWFGFHYVGDEKMYSHPDVSPLKYDTVQGLPPTIIIAAENDVLKDEGIAYAEKLRRDGVPVQYEVISGAVHGYYSNMDFFEEETKESVQHIVKFLNNVHQGGEKAVNK